MHIVSYRSQRFLVSRFKGHLAALVTAAALLASTPAWAVGSIPPSLFKFVPLVRDDKKDEGGGWQEASAKLRFVDVRGFIPRIWSCTLRISVPFRTAGLGRISPEYAAAATASVATTASTNIMPLQSEWLTAEFCVAFKNEMVRLFAEEHPLLGARVNLI